MKIYLANPRGFCAGVDRAIEIVERAIEKHGPPIYVRHEVVHNKYVVNNLKNKGAVFVDEISEVPEGCVVIYSAHGVSQAVRKEASQLSSPPSPAVMKGMKAVWSASLSFLKILKIRDMLFFSS